MKIRISILVVTALMMCLAACRNNGQGYTVYGELPMEEMEGANVYLLDLENGAPIDTTVVKSGSFIFKGNADSNRMAVVRVIKENRGFEGVLVLENGEIHINMLTDTLYGTPLNEQCYRYYVPDRETKEIQHAMLHAMEHYSAAAPEDKERLLSQYLEIEHKLIEHNIDLFHQALENNPDNIIGAYALRQLVDFEGLELSGLDSLMNASGPTVQNYGPLKQVHSKLVNQANTEEGKPYVDLNGINYATGEATRLSDMIDTTKVTLIDFWASWCGPCRKEISENLIRLYDKYGSKGLDIIGIDVWEKSLDDHRKAVESLGITYPQFIDTTRVATDLYGVEGVPTILLIGRDGTILRRGIRGEKLEAAIVEALSMKKVNK